MRQLTINRKKHFVASLMKIYIYIDYKNYPQLDINKKDIPNLVTLRNGESVSLEIPEEKVTVYVIYDKFMPQSFYTKFNVVAGNEEVILQTYAKLNPFQGNPFIIERIIPE